METRSLSCKWVSDNRGFIYVRVILFADHCRLRSTRTGRDRYPSSHRRASRIGRKGREESTMHRGIYRVRPREIRRQSAGLNRNASVQIAVIARTVWRRARL